MNNTNNKEVRLRERKITQASTDNAINGKSSATLINDDRALSTWSDYDAFNDDTKNSVNRYCVGHDDMPEWYNDNSFIRTGYRRITNSYKGCAMSLFYWHNESGNVYTHLIGALAIVAVCIAFFASIAPSVASTDWRDLLVFGCFYCGAVTCLGLSTTYHLCCCHSQKVLLTWIKADYIGIVALIIGSFIPALYYGFYCSLVLKIVYICAITLLGGVTVAISLHKRFASPQYRYFRTFLFAGLGISAVVPLIHICVSLGFKASVATFAAWYIIGMGALYLFGAFVYAYRVPERWLPRVFDLVGNSHQIWHCLVLAGAAVHYLGLLEMYQWRHDNDPHCLLSTADIVTRFQSN